MTKIVDKIKKFFLDSLFPSVCIGCKKEANFICDDCLNRIKIEKYAICPVCNRRLIQKTKCSFCKKKTNLTGLLAANMQNDPLLHQMIYAYKYDFAQKFVYPLSKILFRYLQNIFVYYHFEPLLESNQLILIPVPLHKKRLRWRGFNQSELLANEIGKNSQIPLLINVLGRQRNTTPQMEIGNKKDRQENIKNAFYVMQPADKNNVIFNKTVMLVDDICTTGSTLEECAKTLKTLKPKQIWALVLTKG